MYYTELMPYTTEMLPFFAMRDSHLSIYLIHMYMPTTSLVRISDLMHT